MVEAKSSEAEKDIKRTKIKVLGIVFLAMGLAILLWVVATIISFINTPSMPIILPFLQQTEIAIALLPLFNGIVIGIILGLLIIVASRFVGWGISLIEY